MGSSSPGIYNTEYTQTRGRANGVPEDNLTKDAAIAETQRDSFRAWVEAGSKMVFGPDAAIYPHGDNAAALMKRNDLGQIKDSFLADIAAVEGNPLVDTRATEQVDFVIKGGQIVRAPEGAGNFGSNSIAPQPQGCEFA